MLRRELVPVEEEGFVQSIESLRSGQNGLWRERCSQLLGLNSVSQYMVANTSTHLSSQKSNLHTPPTIKGLKYLAWL